MGENPFSIVLIAVTIGTDKGNLAQIDLITAVSTQIVRETGASVPAALRWRLCSLARLWERSRLSTHAHPWLR